MHSAKNRSRTPRWPPNAKSVLGALSSRSSLVRRLLLLREFEVCNSASVALPAFKKRPEHFPTPALRHRPWAHDPRRVMTYMLKMAAIQLSNPETFVVQLVTNDRLLHLSSLSNYAGEVRLPTFVWHSSRAQKSPQGGPALHAYPLRGAQRLQAAASYEVSRDHSPS